MHVPKRPRYAARLDKALENVRATRVVSKLLATTAAIGTHDGTFHCDEALACGLLKLLPRFAGHAVVRTRDPTVLGTCDVVVDVGGIYEPERGRYDHHQRGFDGVLSELGFGTKLSSAGLIYRHHGMEVLKEITEGDGLSDAEVKVLYREVYSAFVEHVDGNDNGVEAAQGERNYAVTTALPNRVAILNPPWTSDADPKASAEAGTDEPNTCFLDAMHLATCEFCETVIHIVKEWMPARRIVERALDVAASSPEGLGGQVVVLDQYCPWKSHLLAIEKERGTSTEREAKYCLYQDEKGAWRVQAVPVEVGSFASRLPLPEPWCGVRDTDLCSVTGIEGCVFVHASGFIGGHATKEGAVQMAHKALQLAGAAAAQ